MLAAKVAKKVVVAKKISMAILNFEHYVDGAKYD